MFTEASSRCRRRDLPAGGLPHSAEHRARRLSKRREPTGRAPPPLSPEARIRGADLPREPAPPRDRRSARISDPQRSARTARYGVDRRARERRHCRAGRSRASQGAERGHHDLGLRRDRPARGRPRGPAACHRRGRGHDGPRPEHARLRQLLGAPPPPLLPPPPPSPPLPPPPPPPPPTRP